MTDKTEGLEVVAYLAWRDGKPCYEGDDAVCEDAVWPVDGDDDRASMPVVTLASAQAAVAAKQYNVDTWYERFVESEKRIPALEAALGVARETCIDVTMGLERARIWAGMDWAYQPIHPVLYRPLIDKAKAAQALIDTTLGVKT